tara:strand:- start:4907 stop:5356 length:450 start_codon:yes stop_codon:yes gene_type:complete
MNKKILLIVSFIVLYSCSYEPILVEKNFNFSFKNINASGEDKINDIIKRNLLNKSKGKKEFNIDFISFKNKEIISLDNSGNPNSYRLEITVDYIIKDYDKTYNNSIKKQNIYNNIEDKFELLKLEENVLENLSEVIANEILISVSSLEK